MSNIALRFITIALVASVFTACGKSASSKDVPSSGKNEFLDPTSANCAKATDIEDHYKQEIAQNYQVSVSTIKLLSMSGCMMTVDTPVGPKQCGVGGILWYKSGEYDAMSAFVQNGKIITGFGAIHCL